MKVKVVKLVPEFTYLPITKLLSEEQLMLISLIEEYKFEHKVVPSLGEIIKMSGKDVTKQAMSKQLIKLVKYGYDYKKIDYEEEN